MPHDTKKTTRKLRKGVGDIARSSPVIAVGDAVAKVGEKVIEHTPEFIEKYGRKLRDEVSSLSKGRVRRHQRMRRRSASRR